MSMGTTHPLRPRGFRLNTGTTFVPHVSGPPCPTIARSSPPARHGPSSRPSACSRASRSGRRPRASCCSRPATARRACRISAPSPRCSAPRWCARRSHRLSDLPTELYAFSDDMDGLRKVPDNVPNQAMVAEHLGRPLTAIPDPFGTHESYGAHMNARLKSFLDQFGFAYTFKSGSEEYRKGTFNAALRKVLERHDAIREVVLPTLGPERRATYSPILPISPKTGRVLQVPIEECRPAAGHGRVPRRGRHADRGAGDRRPLQDAVEVRLGAALGGARRRLRDVGQGPDRFGQAVDPDLPPARRRAAGEPDLRAVPGRARARRSASPRATG